MNIIALVLNDTRLASFPEMGLLSALETLLFPRIPFLLYFIVPCTFNACFVDNASELLLPPYLFMTPQQVTEFASAPHNEVHLDSHDSTRRFIPKVSQLMTYSPMLFLSFLSLQLFERATLAVRI